MHAFQTLLLSAAVVSAQTINSGLGSSVIVSSGINSLSTLSPSLNPNAPNPTISPGGIGGIGGLNNTNGTLNSTVPSINSSTTIDLTTTIGSDITSSIRNTTPPVATATTTGTGTGTGSSGRSGSASNRWNPAAALLALCVAALF